MGTRSAFAREASRTSGQGPGQSVTIFLTKFSTFYERIEYRNLLRPHLSMVLHRQTADGSRPQTGWQGVHTQDHLASIPTQSRHAGYWNESQDLPHDKVWQLGTILGHGRRSGRY